MENKEAYWTICSKCYGRGKKNMRLGKKARVRYQIAIKEFEKTQSEGKASVRPKLTQYLCDNCSGSGLIPSSSHPIADSENYPHVAIIGAGIGGVALAVACLHRGIPFTLYERDSSFDARAQGYGLTLQQASNSIKELGLFFLKDAVNSTRHVVHTTDGKKISEWGMRTHSNIKKSPRRKNVHIPRQALRLALLKQLGGHNSVQWGHRLVDFKQCENKGIELSFQVNGEMKKAKADLVVGADGVRSVVRSLLIGEDITPLRYLGYVVILGICSLDTLKCIESHLLDSATVFQTVNGHERIYVMPYSLDSVMWQLSFPMPEEEAKALSARGSQALKEEACRRTQWHKPIPQILSATLPAQMSGYPVYDRELLESELLEKAGAVTLIGDAAHPMSPFKGQGANQALLDALALARNISIACTTSLEWREIGVREIVLTEFEEEMLARSASKVKDSAKAVELLHSKGVLREGNEPKGRVFEATKQ
ncbi:2-polyprenyl-6-methoxyphenol hydroxylase-like oxidoreductase [Candidatus Protochlamydia naegleriophila]|uniref:2-polyprenyl-6-methoxyphenol hydroxylase-like oxidoreductase n=1 Tax=Candidatus Protochlamydia naegleriophila TaxID=389348 RepID=A0A0U5JB37_9BACT|nr:NAD(P)/FAD-dependent oxidoreductase [Candidatus Protochlamydia naegleriophila]CUI16301.1 2-polyprenyl-6-methoxyphenol hydroxylase-like oxidoreductase [Candidatus Protochlamydia naegleriophila]